MPLTQEQEKVLTQYANAVAQHVLKAMEANQNPDPGFKKALEQSFENLETCRKKVRELGMIPLF